MAKNAATEVNSVLKQNKKQRIKEKSKKWKEKLDGIKKGKDSF